MVTAEHVEEIETETIQRVCRWGVCARWVRRGCEYCDEHCWPNQRLSARTLRGSMRSIYAIAGADLVKIGSSGDVHQRLIDLQIGSPVPLRLIGWVREVHTSLESLIHAHLAAHRAHGEWFRRTRPVEQVVSLICANDAGQLKYLVTQAYRPYGS